MANSTEPKSPLRVGGIIFAPTKKLIESIQSNGCTLFKGLDAWFDAGSPSKSVIYDHAGALVDHHIPIMDATYAMGIYHRIHGALKPMPFLEKVPRRCFVSVPPIPHTDAEHVVLSKHGIVTISQEAWQAASGHGKMSRGAGHRAKKKDEETTEDEE